MHLDVCKSCGGALERIGNYHICKFCGSKWIIDADNDVHVIDRANAWSALRDCDFERACELFENIIFKEPKNHEAYWGRALANAGIMYVTDYVENKKVPTCNSISESSFIDSRDVKKAIELAPKDIAESYKAQAEQIEAIRVEWVKKASREPAYDVFISYKDSDRENGIERTDDSYDAHELYNALTAEGYKVFFSRVSLRRKIAEQYGLATATKKDSTGICFIGERNFRNFLLNYIPAKKGKIMTYDGKVLGEHLGLMYYTIGQRKGLGIGGQAGDDGSRWFVIEKDLENNILYVAHGAEDKLYSKGLIMKECNWIPCPPAKDFTCTGKFRYRQPEKECTVHIKDDFIEVEFKQRQRAITEGQFAVFYDGDKCIGGGVIEKAIF